MGTFSNAQEVYDRLGACVLRIVQQEEPSEAINAMRLPEIEKDQSIYHALRLDVIPTTTNRPGHE